MKTVSLLMGWAVAASAGQAQASPPPAAGPMTPAQVLSAVRASDLRLSPDGAHLAYVATSYRWDAAPRLRLVDLRSGVETELTPTGASDRAPQWSPDGSALGFLSTRGGRSQVWTVAADGTKAAPATTQKRGVDRFRWSPDGRRIAYLAPADEAPTGDAPRLADDPLALPRLWVIDLASKSVGRLGPSGWRIEDLQWRDDQRLLVAANDRPRAEAQTEAVYELGLDDAAPALVAVPPPPFDSLTLAPDGQGFAVRSTLARGPQARDILLGPLKGGAWTPLWPAARLSVAQLRWRDAGHVYARLTDGFRNRLVDIPVGGEPVTVDLPLSIAGFDVGPDGEIAFVGEDFAHLPQVFLKRRGEAPRQLGDLQAGDAPIHLEPTSIFWTRSFDGAPVEAALVTPLAVPPGGKSPLVLLVHGGPSSNFTAGFTWESAWAQMLASHGYQVLMVNPRGSNGYSEAFLEANRRDWGGGDYRDLMTVLDAVIARGGVDPDRLGIGGWSYGGEMSAWAITQTRRFKAAVAGAPVYDQQAEYESERGVGDAWWLGTPWDNPQVYARSSPATFIKAAKTPTLILDGEDDLSNPVAQSKGLYRALKQLGVETTLVTYPGEGHSPRSGANNRDMFGRILDWYDPRLKP